MKKIMFSDQYELTRAVLDGRKTQTRRIVKGTGNSKFLDIKLDSYRLKQYAIFSNSGKVDMLNFSYQIGDIVAIAQRYSDIKKDDSDLSVRNTAGWDNKMFVKAIDMVHHIRITGVRVERLQDINDEDCFAEGIYMRDDILDSRLEEVAAYTFPCSTRNWFTPREAYAALIDKISGKGTWESNPYVFVYEFERID